MKPKPVWIIGVRNKRSREMFTETGMEWFVTKKKCAEGCKEFTSENYQYKPIKYVPEIK